MPCFGFGDGLLPLLCTIFNELSPLQEQIGEVLDAMFERRVEVGECVIKQGDDGDNFYVIES